MEEAYRALGVKLAFTSVSACIAETLTYPIDAVKTRLQLQGQISTEKKTVGALETATRVLRKEGIKGLYAGLSPALVRHVFYSGTRISVYEQLKATLQQQQQQQAGGLAAQAAQPGVGAKLLMGLTAGAVGQAVAVPADLVKVRMQADARAVAAGKQVAPRYQGMADALVKITRQEGVVGLWRGASPAVQRAALVNLGELATYDQAKQAVLATGWVGDNVGAHTAASVCSGFFASLVSTPADVVKTRMMGQHATAPLYTSSLDCLIKSVRAEGVMALYKGFLPTWMRLGPWQLVFWVSYEQLRKAAGLGGF